MSHRSQSEINAEIYGELSTNLFKLEKVCPISMQCAEISYFMIGICYYPLSVHLCRIHISKYCGLICIHEKHCPARHGVISCSTGAVSTCDLYQGKQLAWPRPKVTKDRNDSRP